MSSPRIPEPFRAVARAARRAGWEISRTRSDHLRWRAPDGTVIVTASTPSCPAGSRNAIARLRRAGLRERS
jgi:predicted RNA binding protein YcfA (HicA-like mRNA interferase family)